MKGLLHSKKFRNNLYKWLIAYVGVMLLLTTVITYSKYISSLEIGDEARATKFKVRIDFTNCSLASGKTCDSGVFLANEALKYSFSVDTSELEANALLALTITVNKDFEVLSLENKTTNTMICQKGETLCDGNVISLFGSDGKIVPASKKDLTNYEITVKYTGNESTFNYKEQKFTNIVKVGYSAMQVIN